MIGVQGNKWNQEQEREKRWKVLHLFIKHERHVGSKLTQTPCHVAFWLKPMSAWQLQYASSSPPYQREITLKPGLSHNQFLSASVQVTELKERLRPMRGFWVSLPHTICNDEKMAADVTNEDRCWNGQTRGRWVTSVRRWGWGRVSVEVEEEEKWASSGAEV